LFGLGLVALFVFFVCFILFLFVFFGSYSFLSDVLLFYSSQCNGLVPFR